MMLPFTLPSMRNVPVTVSVPSSVTPWSMNPVHSSLMPFFEALGHFHAIAIPQIHYYSSRVCEQVNAALKMSCRMKRLHRWTVVLQRLEDHSVTSSSDRKCPSTARHRNTRAPTAPGAFLSSDARAPSSQGAAEALPAPIEYSRPHEFQPRPDCFARAVMPGVQSAGPSAPRVHRVAHTAFGAANPARQAMPGHAQQ